MFIIIIIIMNLPRFSGVSWKQEKTTTKGWDSLASYRRSPNNNNWASSHTAIHARQDMHNNTCTQQVVSCGCPAAAALELCLTLFSSLRARESKSILSKSRHSSWCKLQIVSKKPAYFFSNIFSINIFYINILSTNNLWSNTMLSHEIMSHRIMSHEIMSHEIISPVIIIIIIFKSLWIILLPIKVG